MPYADEEYYKTVYKGSLIPDELILKALRQASRHIDILTFNRITGRGISSLNERQQAIIKEVCCELAEFEYDNEDLINSVLKNYSINGVSVTFDSSWNMAVQNGVAIKRDIYAYLETTGLCSRILRR